MSVLLMSRCKTYRPIYSYSVLILAIVDPEQIYIPLHDVEGDRLTNTAINFSYGNAIFQLFSISLVRLLRFRGNSAAGIAGT